MKLHFSCETMWRLSQCFSRYWSELRGSYFCWLFLNKLHFHIMYLYHTLFVLHFRKHGMNLLHCLILMNCQRLKMGVERWLGCFLLISEGDQTNAGISFVSSSVYTWNVQCKPGDWDFSWLFICKDSTGVNSKQLNKTLTVPVTDFCLHWLNKALWLKLNKIRGNFKKSHLK